MKSNNYNKGQVSIEILAILGVVIVGAVIAGSMYISNIQKNTVEGDELNSIVDQFGDVIDDDGGSGYTSTCGNGSVDSGEVCDDTATPSGCSGEQTCLSDCSGCISTPSANFFSSLDTSLTNSSITTTSNAHFELDANTNVTDVKLTKLQIQKYNSIETDYSIDTTSCQPAISYTVQGEYFIINPVNVNVLGGDGLYHTQNDFLIHCDVPGTYRVKFYGNSSSLGVEKKTGFKPAAGFEVTESTSNPLFSTILSPGEGQAFTIGDAIELDAKISGGIPDYFCSWYFQRIESNQNSQYNSSQNFVKLQGISKKERLYFAEPPDENVIYSESGCNITHENIRSILDTNFGKYNIFLFVTDNSILDNHYETQKEIFYYNQLDVGISEPSNYSFVVPDGSLTLNPYIDGGSGIYACKWYSQRVSHDPSREVGVNNPFISGNKIINDANNWDIITNNCNTTISDISTINNFKLLGEYKIKLLVEDTRSLKSKSAITSINVTDSNLTMNLSPPIGQMINQDFTISIVTTLDLDDSKFTNNAYIKNAVGGETVKDEDCIISSNYTKSESVNRNIYTFQGNNCSTSGVRIINSVITSNDTPSEVIANLSLDYNITDPLNSLLYAEITPPAGPFAFGDIISFQSTVSGGVTPYTCTWSATFEQPTTKGTIEYQDLGTDCSLFNWTPPQSGPYNIKLEVEDSMSNETIDDVNFDVIPASLYVNILSPENSANYMTNELITFSANIINFGGSGNYTCAWKADGSILRNNCNNFDSIFAEVGSKNITLQVTDNEYSQVTGYDSVNIIINDEYQ